jgi:hypothetical protein
MVSSDRSGSSPSPRGVLVACTLGFLLLASGALAGCLQQFQGQGSPGGWALDFLTDDRYSRLLVEIDHEPGAAPEQATINMLQRLLEDRLNKPGGVEIRLSAEIDGKGSGAKYSFEEIRALERQHRDNHKSGDRAVLYAMWLNGGSTNDDGDSRVLGAVYSGSSMVMFKDNLRHAHDRCRAQITSVLGSCPSLARIEDAVTTHEVGHVLGLVNLNPSDVPMVHEREDPESEGHSRYEDSVMYRAVRTSSGLVDLILRGQTLPTEFDRYDIEDLRNAGGK